MVSTYCGQGSNALRAAQGADSGIMARLEAPTVPLEPVTQPLMPAISLMMVHEPSNAWMQSSLIVDRGATSPYLYDDPTVVLRPPPPPPDLLHEPKIAYDHHQRVAALLAMSLGLLLLIALCHLIFPWSATMPHSLGREAPPSAPSYRVMVTHHLPIAPAQPLRPDQQH